MHSKDQEATLVTQLTLINSWEMVAQAESRTGWVRGGLPKAGDILTERGGSGAPSGPSQERTGESGAFGLWPHPRGSSRISS